MGTFQERDFLIYRLCAMNVMVFQSEAVHKVDVISVRIN